MEPPVILAAMKTTLNTEQCALNDEYPEGLLFDVPSSNIQRIIPATMDINEQGQGRLAPAGKPTHAHPPVLGSIQHFASSKDGSPF